MLNVTMGYVEELIYYTACKPYEFVGACYLRGGPS